MSPLATHHRLFTSSFFFSTTNNYLRIRIDVPVCRDATFEIEVNPLQRTPAGISRAMHLAHPARPKRRHNPIRSTFIRTFAVMFGWV